jgi:hypothetical protein
MSDKFICNICKFTADRKSNLDKHYNTWKHKYKQKNEIISEQNNTIEKLNYKINILKNEINSNELTISIKDNIIDELNNKNLILEKENKHLSNELFTHKDNIEFLKHLNESTSETSRQFAIAFSDSQKAISDSQKAISDSQRALNNTSKVANKSIDAMKFIMENYKDAPNIEDIPIILTEDEMKALEINPVSGSTDIIKRVYIDGIDPQKRSVWCMDAGRLKFTTRHKGEWVSDPYGKILRQVVMNAIVNQAHKRATNIFQDRNPKDISTQELKNQTKRIDKIKHINQEKTQETIIRRVSGDFVLDKEANDIR